MNEKKEYIERGALIDSFENCYYLYNSTDREIVRQALENAPAADVAPVVHGKWKPYRTPIETRQSGWICTNCSGVQYDLSNGDTDYCPRCGARMDGGSNESS